MSTSPVQADAAYAVIRIKSHSLALSPFSRVVVTY